MVSRAVIFDLDGTLVDSEPQAVAAFAEAFAECGGVGAAPVEMFLALAGAPFEEICRLLDLPVGTPASFRAASRRRHQDLRLFAGARDLLDVLSRRGVPMAIITGKDRPRTLEVLERLGLTPYFQAVATPDDPPAPKPSGDGVRWLCDRLGVTDAVIVGDSPIDIRAGTAAGAVTVACRWGAGTDEALEAARPQYSVASVPELHDILRVLTAAAVSARNSPAGTQE